MRKAATRPVAAAILALALVAAACGGDGDGGGGGGAAEEKIPVTVYFQGALTGDFNYLVIHSFRAAQIRFDELNAQSGFPAEVTLKQADTQGDPEQAPPVVEEIVADPETVAVEGPGFSGESEASGDTFNEAQIPFVTPSATATILGEKGWDYWYRGVGSDAVQGSVQAEYLAQVLKAKSVFVSHDKSTYGQGLAEVAQKTLQQEGVDEAGFAGIESGTADFSAFISDVQAANPDLLYFGGYDADFAKIVKQARDAGFTEPMMSGDGAVSSVFIDGAGQALEDVHLSCGCNLEGSPELLQKLADEYGAGEYGPGSVPVYAAEGYDVATLIGNGIKEAIDGGAQEPEEIRQGIKEYLDGLAESPFQGLAKAYSFDENGELAAQPKELFFFYEATPQGMKTVGPATEVLQ
jgi:branched-chain amino acid transport system substrate-binding protein